MTIEEIAALWGETAERLALLFAGEPDDKVEAALAGFRGRVLAQWGAIFDGAEPEQLASVVEAVVGQIRARRREIEAAGGAFSPTRQTEAAPL